MNSIRWVCVSDLHLGALNSLLTNVTPDGERVDGSAPSPVLSVLCDCLRSLRRPGEDPPDLVVLGDLFELALTAPEDAAATFSRFVSQLRPGARMPPSPPPSASCRAITTTTSGHGPATTATSISSRPTAPPSRRPGTATPPICCRPTTRCRSATGSWRSSPGGANPSPRSPSNRAIRTSVWSTRPGAGPSSCPTATTSNRSYRMMSLLDTVFGSPTPGAVEAWQLEADNGGWIDFFWSSMGDSGDIMGVTRSLYESLQSHEAVHAEIAAIERAIKLAGRSRMEADAEAHAVAGLLRAGIGTVLRERHRPGVVLSPNAEEGLTNYLNGAVAGQSTVEIGNPRQVTFVFGHTHKPFVGQRTVGAFAAPVDVVNTGGWVVDTPSLDPIKGASLVLIDEELNVASVRCYTEGTDPSSYRVRVEPSGPEGAEPSGRRLAYRHRPRPRPLGRPGPGHPDRSRLTVGANWPSACRPTPPRSTGSTRSRGPARPPGGRVSPERTRSRPIRRPAPAACSWPPCPAWPGGTRPPRTRPAAP